MTTPIRPRPPHSAIPDPGSSPHPGLTALLRADPEHWYSEDELDAIERLDVELALRIDRAQHFAAAPDESDDHEAPVDAEGVAQAIDEARRILSQDGGDIELVGIEEGIVRVRMKGACAGCPNAPLDLRHVVERLIRSHSPGVHSVVNAF